MQNAVYKMSAVAPPLLIYILCHLYFACPQKPEQIKMRQKQVRGNFNLKGQYVLAVNCLHPSQMLKLVG